MSDIAYPQFDHHIECSYYCAPPQHAMQIFAMPSQLDRIIEYLPHCGVIIDSWSEVFEFNPHMPMHSIDMEHNTAQWVQHASEPEKTHCYLFMIRFKKEVKVGV